jgi:NADH:flavin oxidoreductase / NADH oxidase family
MSKMKIAGVEFVTDHPGGLRTPVDQRPLLFRPITMRGVTARNRIMLGPMSQYLASDGNLTDWHIVHLGQFAIGGAGIVCSEETAVEARGRRTHNCAGMYTDEHVRGYRRITDFLKDLGAVPASSAARRPQSRRVDGARITARACTQTSMCAAIGASRISSRTSVRCRRSSSGMLGDAAPRARPGKDASRWGIATPPWGSGPGSWCRQVRSRTGPAVRHRPR